ncbi:MAG: hypothetical protein KDJ38_14500 [Gammaproteobacteria bacterium]|nr:hypothetical protein [Gammaproteobacteria bacterium]
MAQYKVGAINGQAWKLDRPSRTLRPKTKRAEEKPEDSGAYRCFAKFGQINFDYLKS